MPRKRVCAFLWFDQLDSCLNKLIIEGDAENEQKQTAKNYDQGIVRRRLANRKKKEGVTDV